MERTEIVITSGGNEPHVYEQELFEGENALHNGYQRFLRIIDGRADWLLGATVKRDSGDNMTAEIRVRIGPLPFWSREYLKEHDLKYAPTSASYDLGE